MDVLQTPLAGAVILKPKRFEDSRGFFSETYSKRRLEEVGLSIDFVQDNLSYSRARFTVRGLHYQSSPYAQAKLVGVVRGAALDVIVDLRQGSQTFSQHFATELSADEGIQVFVPVGFAHGFITREPHTVVAYKVSAYYAPDHDTGLRFDDPRLGIDWGADLKDIILSDKDQHLPPFDPGLEYFA